MTPLQYEQMKDFAIRMATVVYAPSVRPSSQWIRETLEGFFDEFSAGDMEHVRTWDQSHRGGLLCDWVTQFLDEVMPSSPQCRACRQTIWGRYGESDCRCDEIEGAFLDQWNTQWGDQVRCCIRAAVDLMANESGVLGFTAGDVRRMYPEGIPDWVLGDAEWRAAFTAASDDAGICL